MNKRECKKYIRKAFLNLKAQSKKISIENLSMEMDKVIEQEKQVYIAYAKIGLYLIKNSANEITANEITANEIIKEIDVIPQVYSLDDLLKKANTI